MSMLDSIQAAEQKAENYRNEASKFVKELLEKNRVEAEEKVKLLFQEAEAREKQIYENSLTAIAHKKDEINLYYEKQDLEAKEKANSRVDVAINYILKKVTSI